MPLTKNSWLPVCLLAAGLLSGCDDGASAAPAPVSARPAAVTVPAALPPAAAAAAPAERKAPQPMPGGGMRLDLRGEGRHVRGLQRQPDGTYKSVCVDAPDALRPRGAAGGGQGGSAGADAGGPR